jgi:carboxyl-terminal processing protease
MSRRFCRVYLAVTLSLFDCSAVHAQPANADLSLVERALVASKIYAAIQTYFAHGSGVPKLDLDVAYKSYLDQALGAKDRREFDLATLEFIAQLRNKHTQFDDQWLRRTHGQPLGFGVLLVEDKWVISRTRDSRLKPGDVVRAIDGVDVEEFVGAKQKYINESSERGARNLVFDFDRTYLFPRRFTLELEDGRKLKIDRRDPDKDSAPNSRLRASEGRWLSEGTVGYIKIPAFNDPSYERTAIGLVKEYRGARCLILDLRGNGGGTTPYELIGELMDREWRGWSTSTPLLIALALARGFPPAQQRTESRKSEPRAGAFTGRLVLLVDRFCCSACEDFVMPFKDNGRAILVGETTEGSSGQPYNLNLGNGMSLQVGAERHTFPDGSPFESVGITPTITIDRRLADIRDGVDPVLDKAIELANAH